MKSFNIRCLALILVTMTGTLKSTEPNMFEQIEYEAKAVLRHVNENTTVKKIPIHHNSCDKVFCFAAEVLKSLEQRNQCKTLIGLLNRTKEVSECKLPNNKHTYTMKKFIEHVVMCAEFAKMDPSDRVKKI